MPPKRQGKYMVKKFTKRQKKEAIGKAYTNKTLLVRPLTSERKWYQIGFAPFTVGSGQVYALNPFYLLSQGASQDQRLGLTIQNVNIYVDVQYQHFGCSSIATGKTSSSNFRALMFGNPAQWHQTVINVMEPPTAGTGTVIPISTVFLDSGVDRMSHSYLNKDYNRILYDSGQIKAQSSSAPIGAAWSSIGFQASKRFNIKLGDMRYTGNALSYLRDDNVYLWLVADYLGYAGIAPSTGDQLGQFSVNFLVTFSDS